MSEIRSLGTAGRLKRALVASGLALATVSWLGVSAMPASSTTTCQFLPGGLVVFNPDETTGDDLWMRVDDSDGRLRVEYSGSDYACTNNPSQTKLVKSISLGSDYAYLDAIYLDLGFLQDNGGVDITAFSYDSGDTIAVYNTQDDPQGGLDITVNGGRDNVEVNYGDIHIDVYNEDDYFSYIAIAGTGADDTIDVNVDQYGEELYVCGDVLDYWNDTWTSSTDEGDCDNDNGRGDDVIDLSDVSGTDYSTDYTFVAGGPGDDTITGSDGGDYIYGGDGFDWVEDGRGDDDVEAEWFFAGAVAQGADTYDEEDDDDLAIYDYSARTRDLYLLANDEAVAGENGEEDTLNEDETVTWLLGGSGNDTILGNDEDYGYVWYLSPGAGTNRVDCNWDWDAELYTYLDYEFSPSAVNVDLAAGTATGWGTDRIIGCDAVVGSESADTISGNGNYNEIYGNLGDDTINGAGSGDDLFGDGGDDTINGGDGDDDIAGGDGRDTLNGDAGDDYMGSTVDEEGDCNASDDTGMDDGILDAFDLYELPGDGGTEAGNDKFDGGSGDDYMCGGIGEDRVMLSSGTDVFDGGAGRNLVDASALESGVRIDLQLEEASWDGWNTYLQRTKDAVGSQYNDRITAATVGALDGNVGSKISGRGGNDEIIGFSGPDQLRGNADNDAIFAGSGNDKLRGGAGNDELWGQGGVDTGNGGAGSDVCKSVERATGCETVLSRQQLV